jgi:hypothetical protein
MSQTVTLSSLLLRLEPPVGLDSAQATSQPASFFFLKVPKEEKIWPCRRARLVDHSRIILSPEAKQIMSISGTAFDIFVASYRMSLAKSNIPTILRTRISSKEGGSQREGSVGGWPTDRGVLHIYLSQVRKILQLVLLECSICF